MTQHDFKPASDKQKNMLRKQGYSEQALINMSSSEAFKIIESIIKGPQPRDVTGEYSINNTSMEFLPQITSGYSPGKLDKDRLIVRQSCLKSAVEFMNQTQECTTQQLLDFAEELEKWVYR